MPKRGGDIFFGFFTVISYRTWTTVTSILEKKVKLSSEQGSHFTFFLNTFPLPSSILSLHLFCFLLLLMTVVLSFTGSDVPQFNQFILGHGARLHQSMPWGSHCPRARPVRASGQVTWTWSSNCHPKDWHSWTPVPTTIFGSLSITWKSNLLDLSPELCTSWEVS